MCFLLLPLFLPSPLPLLHFFFPPFLFLFFLFVLLVPFFLFSFLSYPCFKPYTSPSCFFSPFLFIFSTEAQYVAQPGLSSWLSSSLGFLSDYNYRHEHLSFSHQALILFDSNLMHGLSSHSLSCRKFLQSHRIHFLQRPRSDSFH